MHYGFVMSHHLFALRARSITCVGVQSKALFAVQSKALHIYDLLVMHQGVALIDPPLGGCITSGDRLLALAYKAKLCNHPIDHGYAMMHHLW